METIVCMTYRVTPRYREGPRVTCSMCQPLSCVQLFATPWPIAHEAPLSMHSPGKNTGVGFHFLLQGIFPTQGSDLGLPHCRQILYHLSHQGSPILSVAGPNWDAPLWPNKITLMINISKPYSAKELNFNGESCCQPLYALSEVMKEDEP